MKRFFLLFAIVAVAASCSSVERREAPVRQGYDDDLYGDVESVTQEFFWYNQMPIGDTTIKPSTVDVYRFNKRGDLAATEHNDIVDNRSWGKRCTYDETDRLLITEAFIGNATTWRSRYTYNAEGHMIEEQTDLFLEGKNTKSLYSYDEFGNQVEHKSYIDGEFINRSISKYDEAGREIEYAFYDKNDSLVEQRFSTYDKNGKITDMIMLRLDVGSCSRYCYERDRSGNAVKITTYNQENELTDYVTNSFDGEGNIVEHISYRNDGSISSRSTSKYDAQGNEIENAYYIGASQNPEYVKRTTIVYRTQEVE